MNLAVSKDIRCAIYTRKSTEHGLELEFNSLDAQRDACEAYAKSQAAEGWRALPKRYDDPAYSGGSMDRPALQALLRDIAAGLIDVIIVYKIDRLTRSLTDFAKLIEAFDAKSVSFVAVTQQFNTTTSMGRLTLNVLLSFAQFERELSSERVRDKVAASRKKGKWTGGSVPLGYDSIDKKLVINPREADIVRFIFSRYRELKSFNQVIKALNEKAIVTKLRHPAKQKVGGIAFTYGPLAYLLKNRTYLGETGHKGQWFAGEHEAIVDRATFATVQEILAENSVGRTGRRHKNGALLTGLLFDDRGNAMSPSFTRKRGVRYPFYVSSALLRGRKQAAGSVPRVSASKIEACVRSGLGDKDFPIDPAASPRQQLECALRRIVLHADKVVLVARHGQGAPIELPWSKTASARASIVPTAAAPQARTPNDVLVRAVVRAHVWLRQLSEAHYRSVEELAAAVGLHPKLIRSRISLAFLPPKLTREILSGEACDLTIRALTKNRSIRWSDAATGTSTSIGDVP